MCLLKNKHFAAFFHGVFSENERHRFFAAISTCKVDFIDNHNKGKALPEKQQKLC